MIVEAPCYFMLLGIFIDSPPGGNPKAGTYTWTSFGPYASQTEIIKEIMTNSYTYDELRFIKVSLPLMQTPDHGTVTIDELIENVEVCEINDEPDSNPGNA